MSPAAAIAGALGSLLAVSAAGEPLRVAAAISLKEAITAVAAEYRAQGGGEVTLVFGSSGRLLAQVRAGAEVDVFISAAVEQVQTLEAEGLSAGDSRRDIAGNVPVLIVPEQAAFVPSGFAGLADPRIRRLAIGEPKTVPAGHYASQLLAYLELDEKLQDRMVYAANVRQVLDYVERGAVDAGIVYASDARAAQARVREVCRADPAWHEPIRYPAIVLRRSRAPDRATQFLDFLSGERARSILSEHGFKPPPDAAASIPDEQDQRSIDLRPLTSGP